MMLLQARLPPRPELRDDRENDDGEADGPRHGIETLPPPKNHPEKRKARKCHQQKGNQGSPFRLAEAGDQTLRGFLENQEAENYHGGANCQ